MFTFFRTLLETGESFSISVCVYFWSTCHQQMENWCWSSIIECKLPYYLLWFCIPELGELMKFISKVGSTCKFFVGVYVKQWSIYGKLNLILIDRNAGPVIKTQSAPYRLPSICPFHLQTHWRWSTSANRQSKISKAYAQHSKFLVGNKKAEGRQEQDSEWFFLFSTSFSNAWMEPLNGSLLLTPLMCQLMATQRWRELVKDSIDS